MKYAAWFFLLFGVVVFPFAASATHIMAGEITYRVSGLEVEITITVYSDYEGIAQGQGILYFGDGESTSFGIDDWDKQALPGNAAMENRLTIKHTYPSTGFYKISYTEQNRNAGILNVNDGSSLNIPFYIESTVFLDPSIRVNSSPVLHNPPVDKGAVQQKFTHNPWAIDPDGDSLSFVLTVVRDDEDSPVPNYKYPNHSIFNGKTEDGAQAAEFTINPYTGHISWNSPGMAGEYNIAFKVLEWKKIDNAWIKVGTVTRDMQIIVETITNGRPRVNVPADTFISEGTHYRFPITYEDTEGDSIKVQVFSKLIENGAATIDYSKADESTIYFEWTSGNEERRTLPYTIFVKVIDKPAEGHELATYKAFRVGYDSLSLRVIGEDKITGYGEIADLNIRVYPNPSSDKIRLEGIGHQAMEVFIIDPMGRYLLHDRWLEGTSLIDLHVGGYPPGIYLLILKNKDKAIQHKIMVE